MGLFDDAHALDGLGVPETQLSADGGDVVCDGHSVKLVVEEVQAVTDLVDRLADGDLELVRLFRDGLWLEKVVDLVRGVEEVLVPDVTVLVLARREFNLWVVIDVRHLEQLLELRVEFLDGGLVQVVDDGDAAVLFELGEFVRCEWHVGVLLVLFLAVRCAG